MPLFTVDAQDATPIYAQLERAIRTAVSVGRLPPRSQLPTVRELAVDLAVNANTVARVYTQLEREGILETQRGVGTFVHAAPSSHVARANRERELKEIARRAAHDAAALGCTVPDLINRLQRENLR